MTDPTEAARVMAFRHARDIGRLRRVAFADPCDGRREVDPSHRLVVPQYEERDRGVTMTGRARADVYVSLMLTFDQGTHASGWWRNSDYDQCLHLSMVAYEPGRESKYVDLPEVDRRLWPRVFFKHFDWAWWEPPAAEGDPHRSAPASRYTHHVRLFLDRATGRPIIPEGEVYTLKPWPEGDSPEKVFR